MPKPPIQADKIVVFSGAGISAPSGISTYRDEGGIWKRYRIEDIGTAEAWSRHPERILDFYNDRRIEVTAAHPNDAHFAIADLERRYEVVVITQNIDDLHERAGSSMVIHLHGELRKARSSSNPALIYDIGNSPIRLGELCPEGSQLRPHIVLFGEEIMSYSEARTHIQTAAKLLVVGTSLNVEPAASLLKYARHRAEKVIIDLQPPKRPYGFSARIGSAEAMLPRLAHAWLAEDLEASYLKRDRS